MQDTSLFYYFPIFFFFFFFLIKHTLISRAALWFCMKISWQHGTFARLFAATIKCVVIQEGGDAAQCVYRRATQNGAAKEEQKAPDPAPPDWASGLRFQLRQRLTGGDPSSAKSAPRPRKAFYLAALSASFWRGESAERGGKNLHLIMSPVN